MIFNRRRVLFYDLDTRTTFSVSEEQWDNARQEFEKQASALATPNGIKVSPCFPLRQKQVFISDGYLGKTRTIAKNI